MVIVSSESGGYARYTLPVFTVDVFDNHEHGPWTRVVWTGDWTRTVFMARVRKKHCRAMFFFNTVTLLNYADVNNNNNNNRRYIRCSRTIERRSVRQFSLSTDL